MRRILVGTFLILSLTGVATAAQANHCKRWSDCFFEDQQKSGG